MRTTIPTISLAKPPALMSAAVPSAESARLALGVRPSACARPSTWRNASGHAAAAAGLPVFAGVGTGVDVSAAEQTGVYAAEQRVRHEGSTTSTNLQDQYKLRLMSRRDLRTWRPPS